MSIFNWECGNPYLDYSGSSKLGRRFVGNVLVEKL